MIPERRPAHLVDLAAPPRVEPPIYREARRAVADILEDLASTLRRSEDRFVDVDEAMQRTTLSRTQLWVLERAGQFPRRRRISGNKVGWLNSEVSDWIATRPEVGAAEESEGGRAS